MSFVQKTWQNDKTGGTQLTADELNRIEQGISDAATSGGATDVDGIAPVDGSVPLLTTPGGRAKVWTPKQFGASGDGATDDTAAFLDMIDSGEQHFDLGAFKYNVDGQLTFAEGVNLDGRAGKAKGVDQAATTFVLQSSGSQIWLRSAGFGAHRFMIDGNNIATNPLYIGGSGTGDVGAQPDLSGITVMQAAAGGAAITIDGTQNGTVDDLTLLNNAGAGLKFINHAGGWVFTRTEVTGSGSYNVHGTSAGNILFVGGVFERGLSGTLSDVLIDGVVWFPIWRFLGCTFASGGSAVSGGNRYLLEHRATGIVEVDSCQFAGITSETAIGVLGVADSTAPVLVVRGSTYFTGAGTTAFVDGDSAGVVDMGGEVRGQVAPYGSVPLRGASLPAANISQFRQASYTTTRASAGLRGFAAYVGGDTTPRLETLDGTIKLGDGTTQDVLITRTGSKAVSVQANSGVVTAQVVGDLKAVRYVPIRQSDVTLSADGSVAIDCSLGDQVTIKTAGHALTGITTSNETIGQTLTIKIKQGAAGGGSFTAPLLAAGWIWRGLDANAPTLPAGANEFLILELQRNDNSFWQELSRSNPEETIKAPLASPALTGTPTAPTAAPGTNTTQIATTAFVAAGSQPLDSDLTTIAGLTATTDNFMVANSSAWASRTPAQARTHMGLGTSATADKVAAGTAGVLDATDAHVTRPTNFQAPSGWFVMPSNLVNSNGTLWTTANKGIATWCPIDLEIGKSYNSLACRVITAGMSGGTTTSTLALYGDLDGIPDLAGGVLASGTVNLTAVGTRTVSISFTATKVRYWGALLYVETVAPGTYPTVHQYTTGICVSSSTVGSNARGYFASSLAAMPTTAIALSDQTTPYVVAVGAV